MKFCRKCNAYTDRYHDGDCKPCAIARSASLRAKADPDKVKKYNAAYRVANLDKIEARNSVYRSAHAEKFREYMVAYRIENPEKVRAAQSAWEEKNPAYKRVASSKRRARKRSAGGTYTVADIHALMKLQKSKCACCKTSIKDCYHVDHGIPLALGGSNDRLNLQLLCPTCNLQKHAKDPVDFMQSKGYLL